MREQVERLEDHPELAPDRDRLDRGIGDDLAVEEDVAVVDRLEEVDAAQQRRLARPARADQRDRAVLRHDEVDPAQHRHLAERLRDAPDLDDRSRGHRDRRCMWSSTRASGIVTHRYSAAAASSGV